MLISIHTCIAYLENQQGPFTVVWLLLSFFYFSLTIIFPCFCSGNKSCMFFVNHLVSDWLFLTIRLLQINWKKYVYTICLCFFFSLFSLILKAWPPLCSFSWWILPRPHFLVLSWSFLPLFDHFNSLSPNFRYTPTAGPLLSAPLLSWLKLALSIFTGSRHMPLYCNIKE